MMYELRAGLRVPPLLLVLASSLVSAQGLEVSAPETSALEQVIVTATRREASEHDISTAVTRIDAERIQAESPDVLAEILGGLPGTWFQQTTPGQGIPIIRGLKGSQVLHMVDGMRLNNAFFRNAPNQYLGLVDAFATDHVEVVRGAAGSLYGADAMGGVVNILTPEPTFDATSWSRESSVYGSFNSADDAHVFRATTRSGREGLAMSGGVTVQNHGDRETARGVVAPSAYRSQAADLKLTTDAGANGDFMISAQVLEQDATPRVDELVPGFGQTEPASEQYSFNPNRRSFLHARYRWTGTTGWLEQFEVHAARQVITDDRVTQDYGDSRINFETNDSELDGITVQVNSALPGGTLLTWGMEYYSDTISSHRVRSDIDTGASSMVRSRFPDGSSMDSAAAYFASEWHPGERLTVGGGLRYSAFVIALPSTSTSPAVNLTPEDFTGDLHLVYALNSSLNLVANVGRGFRPPNIFDLGTLGPRPGNRFNTANPALSPESVWSYDLGFKTETGRLRSELFLFFMDYTDKITSVITGEITPEGRIVVRSENRNRVTLYGVEAGLRAFVGDRYELYGTLNLTRGSEEDEAGVRYPADRIPPLNGKLGMVFRPTDTVSLDASVLFAARQDRLSPRDSGDPRIDPAGTPGWATAKLSLQWQARENLQLGAKLENLFDRAYREHGSGIDAPGFNLGVWLNMGWN